MGAFDYCVPSHQIGKWSLHVGIVLGGAAGVAIGGVYRALVEAGLPDYFLVASLGLGVAVGFVTAAMLESTGCRNRRVALSLVGFAALACWLANFFFDYVAFVHRISLKLDIPMVKVATAFTPLEYVRGRAELGESYTHHGFKSEVSGQRVMSLWAGTAVILIWSAIAWADKALAFHRPFCLTCHSTTHRRYMGYMTGITDDDWNTAKTGPIARIIELRHATDGPDDSLLYFLDSCPSCQDYLALTIIWCDSIPDDAGCFTGAADTVLSAVRVTRHDVRALQESIWECARSHEATLGQRDDDHEDASEA